MLLTTGVCLNSVVFPFIIDIPTGVYCPTQGSSRLFAYFFDKSISSICTGYNIINMSVPAQVLADFHAQVLCCFNRLQFLVMHDIYGQYRCSRPDICYD